MTTSTPPAWAWLKGKYAHVESLGLSVDPRKPPDSATFRKQSGGEALSEAARILSESVTLGVQNDSNPDPTYQDCWPSERYPSDGDQCDDCRCVPGQRHSPDCAGVQSVRETPTKLPIGARNEHPACDDSQTVNAPDTGNIAWVCSDCGQDRYGRPNGVSTWHEDTCDICGETKAVTEPRDFGRTFYSLYHGHETTAPETTSPADSCVVRCPVCCQELDDDATIECDHCEESIGVESFAVVNGPGGVFVYHLHCYDEVYWGGQDAGQNSEGVEETPLHSLAKTVDKTLDTLDQTLGQSADNDTFAVPFKTQEWIFEALAEVEIDNLHEILDKFHARIVEMARARHKAGYIAHGSDAYGWDASTRLTNLLEELADATVYGTTGPIA